MRPIAPATARIAVTAILMWCQVKREQSHGKQATHTDAWNASQKVRHCGSVPNTAANRSRRTPGPPPAFRSTAGLAPPDEKPGGKQGARVETGRAEAGQREESGRSAAGAFGAIAAAYRTGRNPVGGATAPGCWGCVPKREAARKFPVTAQPGRGRPRMALALALLPTRSDVPLALWPCAQPDQPDAKATTATGAPRALV